jgi:hypothetical protein
LSNMNQIGILERRKIEAEIIKPIYEVMRRELGKEHAKRIIAEAIAQAAIEAGKAMAAGEKNGANIASFVAIQPLWTKDNALEIEVLDVSDDSYRYNVTRCRYAEMYKALGLEDIGYLLSCNRDGKFIEGYAPDIRFNRTQTIMQGSSHCDFYYQQSSKSNAE